MIKMMLCCNLNSKDDAKWVLNLKENGFCGDIPIVLFQGSLKQGFSEHFFAAEYSVSEQALSDVVKHFGERNVRILVQTQIRNPKKSVKQIIGTLEEITRYLQLLRDNTIIHEGYSVLLIDHTGWTKQESVIDLPYFHGVGLFRMKLCNK